MDKKTRLIIIGVLSIIIVILLSLGLTKAFMKPVEQGGNLTEISLDSCAKIKLTGTSSINLSSVRLLPISSVLIDLINFVYLSNKLIVLLYVFDVSIILFLWGTKICIKVHI